MQNAPLFLCLYIKKRVKRAKISGQTFLTIPWILRQSDILKNLYATRVFHFCLSSWFHGCNEHLKGFNSIKGNKKSLIRQGFSNLMLLYGTSVGSTWGYVVPTKVQSPQDVAWEYRFFDKFQNQAHGKSICVTYVLVWFSSQPNAVLQKETSRQMAIIVAIRRFIN